MDLFARHNTGHALLHCDLALMHLLPSLLLMRVCSLRVHTNTRCFNKSLPKSLCYMARDMGALAALWWAYPHYVQGSWPLTFVWWNLMGFFMWALFVVGEYRLMAPFLQVAAVFAYVLCAIRLACMHARMLVAAVWPDLARASFAAMSTS